MTANIWQLAADVVMRPEAFGGMVFHRASGLTIELDAEAYAYLQSYRAPRALPPPDHPAAVLAPQWLRWGLLCPASPQSPSPEEEENKTSAPPDKPASLPAATLRAPEVVHTAITARCNLACAECYVPQSQMGAELTPLEWCALIDQLATLRVFQLAVGGGEPLLYPGLFEVLAHARKRGVTPNLTTNGVLLDAQRVRRLEEAGVARVNVSWNAHAERALRLLLDSQLHVGVNLLITRSLLPRLSHILTQLQAIGVRQVTVLRPKPAAFPSAAHRAWYAAQRLSPHDLMQLRDTLCAWRNVLIIEVGSALMELMHDVPPDLLRRRGIRGCMAGRRICTVWPDGSVSPCSFLADLDAGNVLEIPFATLWERGLGWDDLRAKDAVSCTAYCIART